jgi:hypothetical protein
MLVCSLLAAVVIVAAGCGGSSATGSSATEKTGSQEGASSQFGGTAAADSIVKFGEEADAAELEEVDATLEKSFDARAAKDWAAQCATLSKYAIKQVEKNLAVVWQKGCRGALKGLGQNAPKSILENNISGAVVAFRVKGNRGYALFHGTDKKDWAMPMEKEGAAWKVGGLVAEEVPK